MELKIIAPRKTPTRSFKQLDDGFGGSKSSIMVKRQMSSGGADQASSDQLTRTGNIKSKKRFVGVRQRPSGRWVAEIKDTTQKIRLWLGTFDSAEEGAKAYDSAARALRGANTRTNFVTAISACEDAAIPAATSKAARLIRLRQIAAANAKGTSEKLGRHDSAPNPVLVDFPLLRQDQSISSGALDHNQVSSTPPCLVFSSSSSSSPLKPALRQIGRRNNNINTSPQNLSSSLRNPVQQFGVTDSPPPPPLPPNSSEEDHHNPHPELVDTPTYSSSSLNLPSSSITSQNLSNDAEEAEEAPLATHAHRVQLGSTDIHPKLCNLDDDLGRISKKHRLNPPAQPLVRTKSSDVSTVLLTAEEAVSSSPLTFSCSSNTSRLSGDAVTLDATHHDADQRPGIDSSHSVSFVETDRASCKADDNVESTNNSLICDSTSSEIDLDEEGELGNAELMMNSTTAPDTIPWSDYVLVDGLDLMTSSCEPNCGVYASAFDFSAEAMDRDSCTSSAVALLDVDQAQYLSDVDSTELIGLLGLPPSNNATQSRSSNNTDHHIVDGECSSSTDHQARRRRPPPLWSTVSMAPHCCNVNMAS